MSLKRTADQLDDVFNTAKSPRRSILRAAESPLRFSSPFYSQETGSEQRRVSFAPDANFRLFDQTQSPNASMRFEETNITEEVHITDNIPRLIDEDEPSMLLNDLIDSPSSSFFRRPSPSPFSNRSRRPDLFGSPRSPAIRAGGTPPTLLSRVSNDGDLTDYLHTMPRGRINIFEEDDDDEEEQEIQDHNRNGSPQQQRDHQHDDRYQEEEDMHISTEIHSDNDAMTFPQPIPENIYSDDESAIQRSPMRSPVRDSIRRPLRSPIRRALRSPIRTPQASPLRSTFKSPQASPIRPSQASPIRPPQRSPIRTLLRSPLRTSLGTPPGESSYTSQNISLGSPLRNSAQNLVTSPVQSSTRSTIRTPQRTSTSSNAHFKSPLRSTTRPPSASPRSFYLHSGQSIEVDPLLDEVEEMPDVFQESLHYYDSQNDITVEKPKMSLSSFLSLAGIKFPTDNLVNTEIAYRDLSFDVPESESEQITSTATLPEIHVYQKACQQLIASIKRSDEIIENIDETVSKVNPQLFTEYLDGTSQTQFNIQEQLNAIKKYSLLRSKQEWFTLFTEALRDFPTSLKEIRDRLQTYRELEQYVGDTLVEIKAYNIKLSEIFHHYRQKEQAYQMVDRDRLNILLSEIQVQKEVYQDLKKSADSLEENVQKLKEEDQALESEIQELNHLLKEIEETMEQNQCITMDDFKNAKMEYNQFSKIFGWKVREMNDTILHLEIDTGVDIITDLQKLSKHHSNAVVCRISSGREERLGPLAELMNSFSVAVKNVWNKHEVNQGVAICWNQIRLIEREIDLLKRRWWVKIQTLEHNGDLNNAGFSLEICLFNFEGKSKSNITFEYRVKDMKKFPELDLSTLELKVCYGGLDHDTVKSLIIEELSKEGILSLEKAMQSVLQKTLVTSTREV